MEFNQALDAVFKDGNRVTRRSWHNRQVYLSMENTKLCITGYSSPDPDDGKPHPLIVNEADYFADDWEVVE